MNAPAPDSVGGLRGSLAALAAGAGAVHFAMVPSHLEHHWTMGVGFVLAGWAQLAFAAAVLVRRDRRLLLAGGLGSAVLVLAYGFVHAVGWPWGPAAWTPEEVTAPGLLSVAFEVVLAIGVLLALQGGRARRAARTAFALPVVGTLVVAMSSATLAVTADDEHPVGDEDAHVEAAVPADDGATPAQRLAAQRLADATRGAVGGLTSLEAAQAAGYRLLSVTDGFLLHYGNPAYLTDDRVLDPTHVEGLVYVRLADGSPVLVGAEYAAETDKGPDLGGPLTEWEPHSGLCVDAKQRIAPALPDGRCLPGTERGTSGEVLRTWTIDYPGGPFAPLTVEDLRTAVERSLDGETVEPDEH